MMNDIVVIGGGLMGSALAWQLSRAGRPVILLEQQRPVYSSGSSYGKSRITRSLGPEGDIFSWLNNKSVQETEVLIDFLNMKDDISHALDDIYSSSPVNYIFYPNAAGKIDHLVKREKDFYMHARNPQEAERLFGMKLSDTVEVIREIKPYSGTLHPGKLISSLHRAIGLYGGQIRYDRKVVGIKSQREEWAIEVINTNSGTSQTLRCAQLALCAGPYNGDLLKLAAVQLNINIHPARVALVFIKINPAKYTSLTDQEKDRIRSGFPVIEFDSDLMYAMVDGADGKGYPIFKIGGHNRRGGLESLDKVWRRPLFTEEEAWGRERLTKYFGMLNVPVRSSDLDCVDGYSCVYSMTPSEIPLVRTLGALSDRPGRESILIGGMSGIGAKGAMAYGLIGADILLAKEEDDDSPMYQRARKALNGSLSEEEVLTFSNWYEGDG